MKYYSVTVTILFLVDEVNMLSLETLNVLLITTKIKHGSLLPTIVHIFVHILYSQQCNVG